MIDIVEKTDNSNIDTDDRPVYHIVIGGMVAPKGSDVVTLCGLRKKAHNIPIDLSRKHCEECLMKWNRK